MSNDKNLLLCLMLGALLHDIGKFVQRARDNPKRPEHNHSDWGVKWFQKERGLAEKLGSKFEEDEKEIIRSCISNHHYGAKYISLADAISAGMDRIGIDLEREETGDPFSDRLISIFSRVSVSDKPKGYMYHFFAFLGEDGFQESFPVKDKKCLQKEYTELFDAFNNELELLNFAELTPLQIVDKIYFLLWKYTWCIPGAVYKDEPDVSLFDHLKTTAAIAGCLHDYHQEDPDKSLDIESPAFQLMGGDISGIQSYIFDVLTQQGRVAKRLRARSLFVQLISEIAAHKILHTFELPLLSILSSAGGNFYILVPNVEQSEEKIEKLRKEFDGWMLENLHGELSINTANVAASGKDLLNFSGLLDKLKRELNLQKYQPHKHALLPENSWKTAKFVRPEVIERDEKACQGCHHYPIVNQEEKLCRRCLQDIEIGTNLPKNNYVAFYKNVREGRFEILDYSIKLCTQEELKSKQIKEAYLTLGLNNTQIESTVTGFKYITTHIPREGESPLDFEKIAEKSNGDHVLGYLKADVDNMGKIFREGFVKPSISRFCSLSRLLETFFAGCLQIRLEKDFTDIYSVFSGGDDFFVVGPWDRVIDFAKEIRKKFGEFTGENPDFTFSAGLILAKSHEPISFCSEEVNRELEKSKQKEGKDKITLFNQTVGWKELDNILGQAKKVISWLQNEPPLVSRGFIYNLRTYGEMYRRFKDSGEKETKELEFVPLMANEIKRNLDEKEQKEVYHWSVDLLPTIRKPLQKDNLPYLKTIAEYILTYTRGGKSEEKV